MTDIPAPTPKPGQSIARRLLIGAALWSAAALIAGLIILSAIYRSQTVSVLEGELEETLVSLSRSITFLPDGRITDSDETLLADDIRFQTPLSGYYWAIVAVDEGGAPIGDIRSDSVWDGGLPLPNSLLSQSFGAAGQIFFDDATGPNDETVRVAVRSLNLEGRATPLVLMAAFDRETSNAATRRFFFLLLGGMLALLAAIMSALYFGVRYALRPLAMVQGDVADVREGRATRLPDEYPLEIQPLSGELNKLLEHNKGVVERARTHVGNLAHALKTPLAVLRNEAAGETPLDDVVRRQTEAMRTNVDHYLRRAQAAARAEVLGARTEVTPVVDALSRMLNKLFDARGIHVAVTGETGLVFRGEKQDLEEMLGNLMENACKWARSEVLVTIEADGPSALKIHVDDNGDGLNEEERAGALQRGVRLDETTPGTGLGLSIVTEIAEMHKGAFKLDHAPLGGLRATLELPRA